MYDRPAPVFCLVPIFSLFYKKVHPRIRRQIQPEDALPVRLFCQGHLPAFAAVPYQIAGERRGKRFCTRNLQKIPALRSVGEVEDSREALPRLRRSNA